MYDELPQRYGTKFTFSDGRLIIHPVEDEADLEERRSAMGLPPMDVYAKMVEDLCKAAVVWKP